MTLGEALDAGLLRVLESSYYDPPRYFAREGDLSWEIGKTLYLSRTGATPFKKDSNPSKRLKWTQRVGQDPTTGQVQVTIRGRYPDTTFPDYEFIVTSAGDDNWKLEQKTPKFQMIGFFSTPEEAQERAQTLVGKKNPRKKTSKKRANPRKKATNVRSLVSKALR